MRVGEFIVLERQRLGTTHVKHGVRLPVRQRSRQKMRKVHSWRWKTDTSKMSPAGQVWQEAPLPWLLSTRFHRTKMGLAR